MPKIKRQPVRAPVRTQAIPLAGEPDKTAVVVKRKRKPKLSVDEKEAAQGACVAAQKAKKPPPVSTPVPTPEEPAPSRHAGGRPRSLAAPCKVLVTLEGCDLVALEGWRKSKGYPHRSAAVRALIAQVCGYG